MQNVLAAYQKLAKHNPNPMQETLFTHIATENSNPALLLKAPTGSGKTEAVLIPSLTSGRRLFLIFPSRSLVDDQIDRCQKYLKQMSTVLDNSYALVVDTGAQSTRTVFREGKMLERGKRHLYDGDVIITTFDKFLYRFFGFGEPRKSYIYPFRIQHSQRRNLFCFDEAHSYDNVAFVNFERLIKALYKVNLDMVVMTATMPDTYQAKLNFLDTVDYTTSDNQLKLENWQRKKQNRQYPDKRIKHITVEPGEKVQNEICARVSQRYEADKRIIVMIETVQDLVPVYRYMRERYSGDNIFLYHGRLSNLRRKNVYRKLKDCEKNDDGYLLFTTSAIEVGCDLDAHLLLTELCNPDQLIQRAGRCNRKGEIQDAEIVVVGNKIRPFLSVISSEEEETYLNLLQTQTADRFQPNQILDIMQYEPHSDYRAEVLFDMLYEYVYEARLENKPLHDRGLVVTRSFEPSLILTTKIPESSKQQPENAINLPIRSCIANQQGETVDSNIKVYQRYYDNYNEEFRFVPLNYGGAVYFKELFIEVPETDFCEEVGYVEVPKVFESGGTKGYRQNLIYKTTRENGDAKKIWLHYLKDLEKSSSEKEIQLPPEELEPKSKKQSKSSRPAPTGGEQLSLFES